LRKYFISLLLIIYSTVSFTQIKLPVGFVETGFSAGTGSIAPFWMVSDQYAVNSAQNNSLFLRTGISSELQKDKKFDYSYGLDLLGRYDNSSYFSLHQAYLQGKIFFFTVLAGKKEELFGNQDSTLSSGGLLWSGNAAPMPKIGVYVNEYTQVPFTKGLFEFKGGISHGWFGSQPYVENAYLHHKYIYIQFGGKLPFHTHFGFHHYAQWGGTTAKGSQPGDLKAFYDIFLAKKSETDFLPNGMPIANTLGNHIGSRNFGIDATIKNIVIKAYWQTIFEDNSGKGWRNIRDGLWGMVIENRKSKLISKFLYEFIHTTDQSGTYNGFWVLNGKRYITSSSPGPGAIYYENGGNDNYFNHDVYKFGWTYNEYTIGSPFITSPVLFKDGAYNHIMNNKVIAHHLGFEGRFSENIKYKTFLTYSLNYGTNNNPFEPLRNQISFYTSLQYFISKYKISIIAALAIDRGEMYGNNSGINLGIKKVF
jgi:hypothetical protein